jgi:hypothetical protein
MAASQAAPTLSPTAEFVWGIEVPEIQSLRQLRSFEIAEDTVPETFAANCRLLADRLLNLPNLKDFYLSNATAASQLAITQVNAAAALARVADLERLLEEAEDQVVVGRVNNESLEASNTALRTDLERTQRSLDLIQRMAVPEGPRAPAPDRSVKIPDPPAFTKGREEYRAFKDKLGHKLAGDAHLFRDDQHKLTYAVGFVTGEAYGVIRSLLPGMQTVEQLISHLDSTYEDSDPRGTAERELRALKQGSTDFSAHYARFQGLMAILGWDGAARHAALYSSLSMDLKETLSRTLSPPDETFEQFVATAKSLDDKARRFAAEKGNTRAPVTGKAAPRQNQSSNYSANPADSTGSTPHKGAAPMDLSLQRRLEAKQAQYSEWASQGVCTKCGDPKHWRKDCPKNQNQNRGPLKAAGTADPAATDVSGKE